MEMWQGLIALIVGNLLIVWYAAALIAKPDKLEIVRLNKVNKQLVEAYNKEKSWGVKLKIADSKKQLETYHYESQQPIRRGS